MHGTTQRSTVGIKAPTFDGTQPCVPADIDLFFPESSTDIMESLAHITDLKARNKERRRRTAESQRIAAQAKNICSGCKFTVDCLEFAIATDAVGIWGGTTDKERKQLSM